MIYIASPYLDPDPKVMEKRFEFVEAYMAHGLKEYRPLTSDDFLISPIVLFHEMAKKYNLPKDAVFWWNYNISLMRLCSHMQVLQIPGWKNSMGVQREIGFMTGCKKLIDYIEV